MAEQEKDPVLEGYKGLMGEFKEHKKRLALRIAEIETLRAGGKLDQEAVGLIVVELFNELHDTTLSFQEDAARLAYLGFGDDGGDDDEPLDDEPDSLLLTADAAMLRRVVSTHHTMLTGMLSAPTMTLEERKPIESMKKDAEAALEFIDEVEDQGPDTDDEEEDGADEEDGAADDPPAASN